jgi:hypothetical protein
MMLLIVALVCAVLGWQVAEMRFRQEARNAKTINLELKLANEEELLALHEKELQHPEYPDDAYRRLVAGHQSSH